MVLPIIGRGLLAGAKALSKTPAGKKLLKQAISKGKTLVSKVKSTKGTKYKQTKGRGGAGARAYATTGAAVGGTGLAASMNKGKSKNPRKQKKIKA